MHKRTMLQSSASIIMMTAFMAAASTASAQDTAASTTAAGDTDVILVSGIRASLADALQEKRQSDNLVEVIKAEDIGKLPDQNLAEVLENITGIQIVRSEGVGTAVQIRGTGANRVEINGVSTVGSGNGRSGISFEDLPASVIAAVEVIKVPEASTIEGSVGGTINLRTLRPLNLTKPVIAFRAQAEHSDLSDTISPRFSGTIGNSWDTNAGEIGIVLSGSYAELDVTEFATRVDRDRTVLPDSGFGSAETFPFLRIQFLNQDLSNQEFETINFTGAFEWKPADNLRFYLDATINQQERIQQSSVVQFSGTTSAAVIDGTTNNTFETVNFGTVDGPNGPLVLGEAQAVTSGILPVGVTSNGVIDPNLRLVTGTSSRLTDSSVLASGAEWSIGRLTAVAEISRSESNTVLPNFSTILDFINPRGPQPVVGQSSDNGVPAVFDTRGGTLQFGLAQGLDESPTPAELLDPANYRLRQVQQAGSTNDNGETAFRLDLNFDTDGILPFFSSVDVGWRHNVSTAINDDVTQTNNLTSANSPAFFRPSLAQFSQFAVEAPDNFNDADGRELFVSGFLQVDPVASVEDPGAVLAAINSAIQFSNSQNGVSIPLIAEPNQVLTSFFSVREKTNALYAQGNFDTDLGSILVRGNVGLRWLQTDLSSTGNNVVNGAVDSLAVESTTYDFFLPRASLVVEPVSNVLVRAGFSRDIRRPNFDDLSISTAFGTSANASVSVGNPGLVPEAVSSFDLSGEFYFSDTGFFSVGVFHKRRTNLFSAVTDSPLEPTGPGGGIERDITPPCEGGGIFNPFADRNVFSSTQGQGICVPRETTINASGVATQTGVEVAFQYDLAGFEDAIGFASGFGFIGNFTYQEAGGSLENFFDGSGGGNSLNQLLGRTDTDQSTPTLDDDVVFSRFTLPNLSNYSYNATLFYDKYGLSARARYSWRSEFFNTDTNRFGLPRVVEARGQLNASVSYAITDQITVGVDGINLLREESNEFCVTDGSLLCEQDFTDRRIVGGISFRF